MGTDQGAVLGLKRGLFRRTLALTAALLLAVPVALHAEETFTATLVPVDGTGSTGSGSATLVLNDEESQVSYNVSYTGLSSPEVGAHIHRPLGGVATPLVFGNPKIGVWQKPLPDDVARLRNGELYILIHSDNFPQGELRGDIEPQVVSPVEPTTWGRIKSLFGKSR